jgi:hypothetical protein
VDWLAACIALRMVALYLSFSFGVGVQFAMYVLQPMGTWEPEEMSQILLTNKKRENPDEVHATNIIKPT